MLLEKYRTFFYEIKKETICYLDTNITSIKRKYDKVSNPQHKYF